MKLVFFGTSTFGVASLDSLEKSRHEIQAIVTVPDKPQGRHLKVDHSPIKEWAIKNKIPHFETARGKLNEIQPELKAITPDLFVVISFGAILPESLLAIPKILSLNVHSSLLPRWRGAAPMHWALMSGDSETGVSVIRMTPKLDAGDILTQKKTAILDDDDIVSLEARLSQLGAKALLETLSLLEQKRAVFHPQDQKQATVARKLTKNDGHIDWKLKVAEIHNRVRAMKEWPSSYSFYKGKRVILIRTQFSTPGVENSGPGVILSASVKSGIAVAAGDGVVRICRLQLEGKKALDSKEFLRGFTIEEGQFFE